MRLRLHHFYYDDDECDGLQREVAARVQHVFDLDAYRVEREQCAKVERDGVSKDMVREHPQTHVRTVGRGSYDYSAFPIPTPAGTLVHKQICTRLDTISIFAVARQHKAAKVPLVVQHGS